jgi:pantothenate synthetase
MAKKLKNMTQDERIAYWENVREKERLNRRNRIAKLSMEQRAAVININKLLDTVLETALYPDMGGIRAVTAYDLQELSDAMDALQYQFNLRGE